MPPRFIAQCSCARHTAAGQGRPGEGKKRNSEHKFHVPMSSSGGKSKVSVVLLIVSEQSFGILLKSTTQTESEL